MKKIICVLICLVMVFTIFIGTSNAKENNEDNASVVQSIEKKLIRFHVIANSDSVEDQALKLKVRDKVLEYISPKLKNSKSIEESRKIIKDNDKNIKLIAERVIKNNGYNYSVNTTLSKHNFPVKTYGNITLPQGEYEAYRIIIGSGEGQNWWCVMFPPLCFIDITKGEVSYKETEEAMKSVLSEKEYEAVDNNKAEETKDENKDKIIIKFKIVEIIKNLFK